MLSALIRVEYQVIKPLLSLFCRLGKWFFNDDARSDIDWQYAAKRVVAPKNYSSIRVLVVYEHNINVVYFDGIQLFKEEFGHSYVYDENGNVTSVTDLQAQTTTYAYTNNRLTSMTLPSGASQTYTYDTYGNVLTSTSPEGVISTFTYDTYGNNLTVTVGTGTQKVTTSATYTSNGNQLSSITDARGNKTTYDYDTDTGVLNWVQAPGETDATRTNYTYDDLYRTTSVSKDSTSNTYAYTDDLLTQSTSAGGTVYTYNYGLFDQTSNIQVGDRTLISHTYASDQNRYLTKSTYGNDDYITYTYDDLGRTTGIGYEDNASAIQYKYNNDGDLGVVVDNMNSLTTKYYYDMQGRLVGYDETGTNHAVSVLWGYDDLNNLSSQKITVNGTAYTESYAYDDDNRITQSTAGSVVSAYTYDSYSRMTKIVNKNSSTAVVTTDIGYLNPSSTATTGLVHTWKNTYSTTNKTYTYAYDNRGNITSISDGTTTTTYVYDQYDQLLRENNQAANKTWVYDYDTAGNILSKTEYAYTTGELGTAIGTITYGYTDETWHELLTEYDGQEISYDGIGNMTSDGTWTYAWEHGRQLATATDGTTSVSYEYNADGMRLSKTVGSTTTKYYYVGSELTYMTAGSDTLHFFYDIAGPATVCYNNLYYYYVRNAQGDIIQILDTDGNVVVSYSYDAWGNVLSVTGSMASTLGALNPLRYRGYVYDVETGLYYLQTRYYDPSMGRFICADAFFSTGQHPSGCNMFAYCYNNPVKYYDYSGYLPKVIEDKMVHDWVLKEICDNNDDLSWEGTCIYYNGTDYRGGWGFCDLYNTETGEVWELKKSSVSPTCTKTYASFQLARYCKGRLKNNLSLELKKPYQTLIEKDYFEETKAGYTYCITYWYAGNGILRYSYYKVETEQLKNLKLIAIQIGIGILYGIYNSQAEEYGYPAAPIPSSVF